MSDPRKAVSTPGRRCSPKDNSDAHSKEIDRLLDALLYSLARQIAATFNDNPGDKA